MNRSMSDVFSAFNSNVKHDLTVTMQRLGMRIWNSKIFKKTFEPDELVGNRSHDTVLIFGIGSRYYCRFLCMPRNRRRIEMN